MTSKRGKRELPHRPQDRIVIERRELVAVIEPDGNAEHPMMRAAFMAVSDAMADVLTDGLSTAYEFVYGSHTFRFNAEPTDRPSDLPHDWEAVAQVNE